MSTYPRPSSDFEVRSVIRFLYLEKNSPIEIHRRLEAVYGPDVMTVQHVRKWCRLYKEGREELRDLPRSGRPSVIDDNLIARVDEKLCSDRRQTLEEIQNEFSHVCESTIRKIIIDILKYRKLCARWVPKMLSSENKSQRLSTSSTILSRYEEEGEEFLAKIVTGDETWVHYDTPETKRQSMQWKHQNSPRAVKFKKTASLKKIMVTVFWDQKGPILIDYLPQGASMNGDRYREILTKLRKALKDRRPGKLSKGIEILHDNARPHTASLTLALLEKFKWKIVPHPPYSPDLAPSDYHLFPKLKSELAGEHFETENEVRTAVETCLKNLDGEFYAAGMSKLILRLKKCIKLEGNYVEK